MGDVTGDGLLDIVVAKMHQATAPQEVCLYRNRRARGWARQVIATTGSHNIALVDTGSDGRLDIFGANWNDNSPTGGAVELWVNQRPIDTQA